jgi:hypothetical protein
MPNTGNPLPIPCCPKCQHDGCVLAVKSFTIMSCTCAKCGHFWATQIDWLPLDIQKKVRRIVFH